MDRTRRRVPRDNPTTEIVTYLVQTDFDRKFYVDDYAPESYCDIGESIAFLVYVKAYKKKNGEAGYTLNIQKDDSSRGDHF